MRSEAKEAKNKRTFAHEKLGQNKSFNGSNGVDILMLHPTGPSPCSWHCPYPYPCYCCCCWWLKYAARRRFPRGILKPLISVAFAAFFVFFFLFFGTRIFFFFFFLAVGIFVLFYFMQYNSSPCPCPDSCCTLFACLPST